MAAADDQLLCMSLDDIIKMKRQGRRGGKTNQRGRGKGRNRNRGSSSTLEADQNTDFQRGRQEITTGFQRGRQEITTSFQRGRQEITTGFQRGRQEITTGGRGGRGFRNRGGRRGLKVLTTKFGIRGASNISPLQGRRLGRGGRGKSLVRTGRGSGILNDNGRGGGRESISQRIRYRGVYTDNFQTRDLPSSSSNLFTKERLQQMQRAIFNSQQSNRKKARNDTVNQRRGITLGMKTSSNLGDPMQVRVGNGTIVRGLRSDQLLLQKIRQAKNTQFQPKMDRLEVLREKRDRSLNARDSSLESNSIVSLSSHRGLTVSIKNNIASNSVRNGTTSRNRPRLNRHKLKKMQESMAAPATFTIINDRMSSSESDFEMLPDPPKRITKRNIITTRDPRPRNTTTLTIGSDNLRTLPEPHRQILDPKIQKEIAMLQGKDEVTLNSGPGPGVKGFKHVPSQTTRSLHERFTNERMVTV